MIKRIILTSTAVFSSLWLFGQDAATTARPQPQPSDFMMSPYFWLFAFLVFILTFAIIVLAKSLARLSGGLLPKNEKQAKEVTVYEKTFIAKFFDKLTDTVPLSKEEDVLMHHDYDGIQELDNNLPPWWKYGFYLTIVFAFFYVLHYHVFGTGKSQLQEYTEDVQIAEEQKKLLAANAITGESASFLKDEESLSAGKSIYDKNCTPCHGPAGGGSVGPNLTDDYWIHGGGIANVFNVISEGVPVKGMLSWKTQFSPKQIEQIASYVLTLQGTNPAGGKNPEGEFWKENADIKSDSLNMMNDTIQKDSVTKTE